jgi:hypothetical protein
MVTAPVLAGLAALGILRPWKNDPDYKKNKKNILRLAAIIGVAFAVWWGIAFWIGQGKPNLLENADRETYSPFMRNKFRVLAFPNKFGNEVKQHGVYGLV